MGGDDGEELGPRHRRQRRTVAELDRIEVGIDDLAALGAFDVDLVFDCLALVQVVENAGERHRDARTDHHVVDAGEHRPIDRSEVGDLDLLQVVDADGAVVAFLGQEHLDEVGGHHQVLGHPTHLDRGHRFGLVPGIWRLAACDVVLLQNPLGDARYRERLEGTALAAIEVAVPEPAVQGGVHPGAGNDAEMSCGRDCVGELRAGYSDSHSALNQYWLVVGHGRNARPTNAVVGLVPKKRCLQLQAPKRVPSSQFPARDQVSTRVTGDSRPSMPSPAVPMPGATVCLPHRRSPPPRLDRRCRPPRGQHRRPSGRGAPGLR